MFEVIGIVAIILVALYVMRDRLPRFGGESRRGTSP